jgi:integrase/recombinase XerD
MATPSESDDYETSRRSDEADAAGAAGSDDAATGTPAQPIVETPEQRPARAGEADGRVPESHAENDDHLISLWLHGKSENTKEAYSRDVEQFRSFLDVPIRSVTLQDLQDWDDYLADSYARSTHKRKMATIKSLFSFAQRIGYLTFNVGGAVSTPKPKDRLAERILSEQEVQRILAMEDDLRNGVLLRLLYASGARVSEVTGLEWRSLQRRPDGAKKTGQVTLFGKGDQTRTVLLSRDTWKALQELRREESADGYGSPSDPVFRSRNGGALSRVQIWRIVKSAAKQADIDVAEKPVSPHWFRHAHASHALDRGAPTHLVKETLGHESLQTTSKYTHARPDESSSDYLNV